MTSLLFFTDASQYLRQGDGVGLGGGDKKGLCSFVKLMLLSLIILQTSEHFWRSLIQGLPYLFPFRNVTMVNSYKAKQWLFLQLLCKGLGLSPIEVHLYVLLIPYEQSIKHEHGIKPNNSKDGFKELKYHP